MSWPCPIRVALLAAPSLKVCLLSLAPALLTDSEALARDPGSALLGGITTLAPLPGLYFPLPAPSPCCRAHHWPLSFCGAWSPTVALLSLYLRAQSSCGLRRLRGASPTRHLPHLGRSCCSRLRSCALVASIGVPKDLTVAVRWYRSAALHGNPAGQLNLGAFYYLGYARLRHSRRLRRGHQVVSRCRRTGSRPGSRQPGALLSQRRGPPCRLCSSRSLGAPRRRTRQSSCLCSPRLSLRNWQRPPPRLRFRLCLVFPRLIMTRRQIDEADSLVASRSIPPQRASDLSAPAPNALFPNR